MKWKNREVYRGYSAERFNRIRELLDQNGISYKWDVDNRQNHFLDFGRGTARGNFGSAGQVESVQREYVIKVTGEEEEKAKFLIGELWRREGWKVGDEAEG